MERFEGGAGRPTPTDFCVERKTFDNNDRVVVYGSVSKVLDCDLDRGDRPRWIEVENDGESIPTVSAFYRPDGTQSGSNSIRRGHSMTLDGYSATIPNRIRGFGGTFTAMVAFNFGPTLWTEHVCWGRNVFAT